MVKNRNIELSTTFINLKFLCIEFKEYLTYFNELPYRKNHYFDIFCNVSHSLIGEKIVPTKPTLYYYKMTLIKLWLHLCEGNKLNICRQGNSDEDQFASTSFLCTLLKVLMLWIICCSVNQNTNLKRILSTHFDNLCLNIHTC